MTMKMDACEFLKEKSILILSFDKAISNRIENSLRPYSTKVEVLRIIPNYLNISKYDLIIIDLEYYEKRELIKTFSNDYYNTPIIFLISKLENIDLNNFSNISVKNILLKDDNLKNISIYIQIILQKKDKIIFKNGYSYLLKENRFYFKNSEVPLTKLEIRLFEYLIKNINRTIDYQELVSNVWDDKNCTIYSIRNVVNKIREKSYYEIISNISKKGYTINNDYIYI